MSVLWRQSYQGIPCQAYMQMTSAFTERQAIKSLQERSLPRVTLANRLEIAPVCTGLQECAGVWLSLGAWRLPPACRLLAACLPPACRLLAACLPPACRLRLSVTAIILVMAVTDRRGKQAASAKR